MSQIKIEGGCLCGKIRYVLTTDPIHSTMCHCSDCRRASGAQSVSWTTGPVNSYIVSQGEPKQYNSSPNVVRTFCSDCGTPLTYSHKDRSKEIDITTGSLDSPEDFPPTKDVFGRDRLSWVAPSTKNVND